MINNVKCNEHKDFCDYDCIKKVRQETLSKVKLEFINRNVDEFEEWLNKELSKK